MAATYIPIASTTLSTSAASVTFSSIPQTYTDLVLKYSVRSDLGGAGNFGTDLKLTINSSTANQSGTILFGGSGTGSGTGSYRDTIIGGSTGNDTTSNTFAWGELYLPNYAGSNNKPFSSETHRENNAANGAVKNIIANLWSQTAAITSLAISGVSGNFVSGSSFHLYGIKNS